MVSRVFYLTQLLIYRILRIEVKYYRGKKMTLAVKILNIFPGGRVEYKIGSGRYNDGRHKGERKFMEHSSFGKLELSSGVSETNLATLQPDSGTPSYQLKETPAEIDDMVGKIYIHVPNV